MAVPADLLDSASLGAAVATVLERWGRIDVVVHNGRYIGPGHMDLFLDTPIELLRKQMEGNFFAPLIINKLVLPSMIARGAGTIVNITSAPGTAIRPSRRARAAGAWATAPRRARFTASPASLPSSWATRESAASTSSPG